MTCWFSLNRAPTRTGEQSSVFDVVTVCLTGCADNQSAEERFREGNTPVRSPEAVQWVLDLMLDVVYGTTNYPLRDIASVFAPLLIHQSCKHLDWLPMALVRFLCLAAAWHSRTGYQPLQEGTLPTDSPSDHNSTPDGMAQNREEVVDTGFEASPRAVLEERQEVMDAQ